MHGRLFFSACVAAGIGRVAKVVRGIRESKIK